ncbi:DUF4350 domain-containing protein [Metabacillus litoralis]|uniref:DUF4350 domain-containing protein n=1 Tax=Metabacillus litoralis TaxID=152268 RepID=UPI001CFD412D|nr:DUF4350 domain-containing protein [Metabacillus litoralis]
MSSKSLDLKKWILIPILLLIFFLSSYFLSSEKPKYYPNYVSNSPAPNGTKAFYTYLENEMTSVARWSQPPNLLPKTDNHNQVLIMIEPTFVPSTEEMEAYMNFIERGNSIILFSKNPKGFFDINVKNDESLFPDGTILDEKGNKYSAEVNSSITLESYSGDEILLHSEYDGVLALKRSYGDGELLVANTPEWLMNGEITKGDHTSLLLTLFNKVDGNSYLFDEYVHGQQNSSSFFSIYPRWFLVLLLQGMIITILYLWYRGKRFGPILVAREETVRFSDERIKAIAAWYIRSRNFRDSLMIQADYVKLLLQENWSIPYSRAWEDINNDLEKKWKNSFTKDEIANFLDGLTNVLTKEKVTKQEYLFWSKKLEHLRKEVEEG